MKFLVSTLTAQAFMEKVISKEPNHFGEYEFIMGPKSIVYEGIHCYGEGNGQPNSFTMPLAKIKDFIAILAHLSDQPILLIIAHDKLWLWQCIVS